MEILHADFQETIALMIAKEQFIFNLLSKTVTCYI